MANITRYLQGLLDLCGLQTAGDNPHVIGDQVVPTVDVRSHLEVNLQVGVVSVLAAPANGPNAGQGLQVPSGEVWKIHQAGMFVLTGVGVTGDFSLYTNAGSGVIPVAATQVMAASSTRLVAASNLPYWLRSGDELNVYIQNLVGAPTVSVTALISRMRA